MKKVFLIALIAVCFCQVITAQNNAKIDAGLQQEMALRETTDLIRVNIILNQQYDQMEMRTKTSIFSTKTAKRTFVVNELKRFSEETQRGVMDLLSTMPGVSEVQSFWIANFINCYANIETIEELSLHLDVLIIGFDKEEQLIPEGGDPTPVDPTREIVANVLKVKADQVWALGYKGEGVLVAVLDTGVNYNHLDLKDHMWEHPDYPHHGWNYVSNNNDPKDDNGHGTHCAGTVAGDGTAGSQTGMAPEATIMALKVLNSQGSGYTSHINQAIQFAVANGADVISMSLGSAGSGGDVTSRNVMINALEAGVIVAVAAGNEGNQQWQYPKPKNVGSPGNCPPPWLHPDQTTTGGTSAVVCVGSTNGNDGISGFSSRGPVTWQNVSPFNDYPYNPGMGLLRPDVCAPGENIKSCAYNNNSGYLQYGWSGTSMATPCVAGVMALMLSKNPMLTPEDICEIVETTAVHLPSSTSPKNNDYGSGRVDALAAINKTQVYVEDIVLEGFIINDIEGNNNGRLNPGETAHLTVSLKNVSNEPINDVQLTFKTSSGLITINNGEANFGNFAANETKTVEDAFTITLSNTAPIGNKITCTLEATFDDVKRKMPIQIIVYDYTIKLRENGIRIPDKTEIGPGETSDVWVYLENKGNDIATGLTATMTTTSSYLIINEATAYYGQLYPEQYKHRAYNVTISPDTPSGTSNAPVTITVTDEWGKTTVLKSYFFFKNTGQPPASCNPIQDLSVEIVDTNAILTWTAPSGGAPEKYLVYCNDEFLTETTSTTYTQTDITGGSYRHCVEALYSNGCTSELSCVDNSLPCDITIELTAEGIPDTEIHLSWLPVLEGLKYNVYRDSELIAKIEGNSYTDSTLDPEQVYCYTITALCAGDIESEPSNKECLSTITAINELQNDIKIYPNPTSGELTVETDNYPSLQGIEILDMMGKCVATVETLRATSLQQPTTFTIDISHLASGIYFIRIQTENGVITRKVVKQ